MSNKNLYVPAESEATIAKLEGILKERKQSLSEFFVEAARREVEAAEANAETEDIVLEGVNTKRRFKGRWLYWNPTPYSQQGVALSRRGRLVYWFCEDEREDFRIFDSFDELKEAGLLEDDTLAEIAAELNTELELDI